MRSLVTFCLVVMCLMSLAQDPPGQYPFTSTRAVTLEDLEGKDLAELKVMRNEVFARHGHTFKGEDLKQHFGAQSWYKATVTDATGLLTAIEKSNVDFIRKHENRISTTSEFESFYSAFSKAAEKDDVKKLSELLMPGTSVADFKNSYDIHKDEIREALSNGEPRGDETTQKLFFGEFYSNVQYKYVVFEKKGCCWYLVGIYMAG